mmetsp:Transcript_12364/g.31624  ORF Transcript_12364/g.31624 Transcript_12364/m.31624 type:complete len:219 (+) Transcript_12364:1561-2217(+)
MPAAGLVWLESRIALKYLSGIRLINDDESPLRVSSLGFFRQDRFENFFSLSRRGGVYHSEDTDSAALYPLLLPTDIVLQESKHGVIAKIVIAYRLGDIHNHTSFKIANVLQCHVKSSAVVLVAAVTWQTWQIYKGKWILIRGRVALDVEIYVAVQNFTIILKCFNVLPQSHRVTKFLNLIRLISSLVCYCCKPIQLSSSGLIHMPVAKQGNSHGNLCC